MTNMKETLKPFLLLGLTILVSLMLTNNTYANCVEPEEPLIPDPELTVTAEMVKAQNDVKAFLAAAEKFLKCTRSGVRHNKMVDKMKDVGDNFNDAVKAYKVRLAST